ncbi:hypothetical protein DV702_05940 [Sporosarcina sp. PTS2304]|uniref:hypothetical protein n=1 Tax=Sporosarcina sp. PTS2304 TaxID=2283194 RepID=UPI000E0D9558|nr:hypothetical protein [Sporosarcina sp. PTS2304]AXH99321.1 hypothetical protein DV702_05940 [Sporosarcina sp. PTS2304]
MMNYIKNEKGFALIIVLFAIVFITAITAVFMRGALGNRVQETTVDENNLVVVAAEAGVDYYTWYLKEIYDKDKLDVEFRRLEQKELDKQVAGGDTIDYPEIQKAIVREFLIELVHRKDLLLEEEAIELGNHQYRHKLVDAKILPGYDIVDDKGNIFVTVRGEVEGELPSSFKGQEKKDTLTFEYTYIFPEIKVASDTSNSDTNTSEPPKTSIVVMPTLKEPKPVAIPQNAIDMGKPKPKCTPVNKKIDAQKCNNSSIDEASYSITNSHVFLDGIVNSWGTVFIEKSLVNINNDFTPATLKLNGIELIVAGKIGKGYSGSSEIENSIIRTNSYDVSGQVNFNKTDLKVITNYHSGGASFKNSTLEVAGKLDTGGGLFYVEGSNVKIFGNADTHNGSTIKGSVISIDGNFMHTSKPLDAENSDIFVKGDVTTTNHSKLDQVNMNVLGGFLVNGPLTLSKTNLNVEKVLKLTNGGTLNNSLVNAKGITITTPFTLNGSIMSADYITTTNHMTINNSEICVGNFTTNGLTIDSNSKIYYSGTSNHNASLNDRFVKLSKEDFTAKCGVSKGQGSQGTTEPNEPHAVDWQLPVLDKVIY